MKNMKIWKMKIVTFLELELKGWEDIIWQDDDDRAPEYFDDTAKKEYVEEDDEEGGDGEEVDAVAIVHPTVDRIITVPDGNLDSDDI